MGLFKADFYRSLLIGFAVGAVAVLGTVHGFSGNQMVAEAHAEPAR